MGSRLIRIVIEGYVDKDLTIDLANDGGTFRAPSADAYMEAIAWLGAIAQEGPDLTVTVERADR